MSYRIVKITSKTEDRFHGFYKGHEIEIEREEEDKFYIQVTAPDGCYVYDGWWTAEDDTGMDTAIHEALVGSVLIEENKN